MMISGSYLRCNILNKLLSQAVKASIPINKFCIIIMNDFAFVHVHVHHDSFHLRKTYQNGMNVFFISVAEHQDHPFIFRCVQEREMRSNSQDINNEGVNLGKWLIRHDAYKNDQCNFLLQSSIAWTDFSVVGTLRHQIEVLNPFLYYYYY